MSPAPTPSPRTKTNNVADGLRRCSHCKQALPLDRFAKHSKQGLQRDCKECRKQIDREYRIRTRDRKLLTQRKWREANPDKYARHIKSAAAKMASGAYEIQKAAREKVARAKRSGRLTQLPCEVCGSAHSQAHHDDYSKPLDVRWLCKIHHSEIHRKYQPK